MNALETQVGGSHYKELPIGPMEYSMANGLDACQHTIIKYVTRFRQKGGIQDLEKARHVIDMLIEFERKREVSAANEAMALKAANDNAPPIIEYSDRKRAAIDEGRCKADIGSLCNHCVPDGICKNA